MRLPVVALTLLCLSAAGTPAARAMSADSDSVTDLGITVAQAPSANEQDQAFTVGRLTVRLKEPDIDLVPDSFVSLAGKAAGLVDYYPSDFTYSAYDSARDAVVITATTDTGTRLAKALAEGANSKVLVQSATFSHEQIKTLGREFIAGDEELTRSAQELGVLPQGTGFYIMMGRAPYDLDAFSKRVQDLPVDVELWVDDQYPDEDAPVLDDGDRRHERSPFYAGGGFAMGRNNAVTPSFCSWATSLDWNANDFMVTAGHCFPRDGNLDQAFTLSGTSWASPTPTAHGIAGNAGSRSTWRNDVGSVQTSDNQFHGDVGLINVQSEGNVAGRRLYDGGPNGSSNRTIVSRDAPAIGISVCLGGATSGLVCSVSIRAVNVDMNLGGSVWLREADRARGDSTSDCSAGGDSGGSIHNNPSTGNAKVIGVISGHTDLTSGECTQRFTGVEEAIQAWGGEVKFAI